jgi:aspartyl-tRNA(Asn)/glutamyl-tRNA(Gln) amidotransferase subunit A
VAAGVTPIALGTDGGGSIRMPCGLTGLVGIKATAARIPVWPPSATPTLAHVGPIARTVEDAALLLRVCAGPDRRDPFSLLAPIGEEPTPVQARGLRVALSPTLGYARVDAPVAAVVAAAVKKLEGAFDRIEVVEKVCEEEGEILAAEFIGGCSARLGDLVDTAPDQIDPPLLAAVRDFRKTGADRYTRLLRRRLVHRERLRLFFERFDVLLTPTTPCTAWSIDQGVPPGHEHGVWSYFTYPFNLSGQPAASLPCGLSADGLPVGLQLVAPLCAEAQLIVAMRLAEQALAPAPALPVEPH